MGAGGFHGRVRDGIGWSLPAMATRSSSRHVVCGLGGVAAGSGGVRALLCGRWVRELSTC